MENGKEFLGRGRINKAPTNDQRYMRRKMQTHGLRPGSLETKRRNTARHMEWECQKRPQN